MQGAWELWVIQVLKLFSLQGVLSLTTFQNCQGCDELADSDQGRAGRRLAQQQHVPHRRLRSRDVNEISRKFSQYIRTRLLTIKHFKQLKGHCRGFSRYYDIFCEISSTPLYRSPPGHRAAAVPLGDRPLRRRARARHVLSHHQIIVTYLKQ